MAVLDALRAAWPTERWRDVTVLVAVSGGADSVALLRALVALREVGAGRLVVAHFNHRLRGTESDADQAFVDRLAQALHLPVVISAPERALLESSGGQGLEAAARQARYDFLATSAAAEGARYIATAHTADDQAETVLHNVLRGTGLVGLAGIPRVRQLSEGTSLIRPLLEVTRTDVLEYLRQLGQPFCDDSTNELVAYTRNRIRHSLLPQLEGDFYPGVRQSLLKLAKVASQTIDYFNDSCQTLFSENVRSTGGSVEVDCAMLKGLHVAVLRQLFVMIWQQQGWPQRDMSLEKWEQLVALAQGNADQSVYTLPGSVRAEVRAGWLVLARHA